jgi:hypothetical protein
MTQQPTQTKGDKTRQALTELSSLLEQHPEKSRKELLQAVEVKFDLTPKECAFLNQNFEK